MHKYDSFKIEWNVIVVSDCLLIMNQTKFRLGSYLNRKLSLRSSAFQFENNIKSNSMTAVTRTKPDIGSKFDRRVCGVEESLWC